MSYNEFWYGDIELLNVYQKAYYRDRSYTAWLNGQFTSIAFGIVMSNAFAKKGAKKAEYPKWVDPMEKFERKKLSEEDLEIKFRQQQYDQQSWLFAKK